MDKTYVIGSKGQLGHDLMRVFRGPNVEGLDLPEFDITDYPAVLEKFSNGKPSVVILTAAYTDVDGCEDNEEIAFRVNAEGTANIVKAAKEVGAGLLYTSTDYVFDGQSKRPYLESDKVNPQSVYGRSKRAGEKVVMSLTDNWYIVRTAWLYGHGSNNNFVKTILNVAAEKGKLKVVNDQHGSPTYTLDLASKILEIVESQEYGIYHVTNSGQCTWYDFAKEILRLSGIEAEISPCTTDEFPRPASRPAFSVLKNRNLQLKGFSPMRPWQEALKSYFSEP